MSELVPVDFSINPKKVERAARKILALEDIRRDYQDENIIDLAEEDMLKAMKRLNRREQMEVPKKAQEIIDVRNGANKRYSQGMEE
jgi:hypothetical protein